MSQDLEQVLRKSLDEVDRSQKWQYAGLTIFLLFLLVHMYAFIGMSHSGPEGSPPSRHTLAMGIFSVILMVGVCTFGITVFIARMTKRVLKAIELSSKP
jgi:hypothetical protein